MSTTTDKTREKVPLLDYYEHNIPTDYADILRGRVVLITGVGRSGTSILGKIVGSLESVEYIYEPALIKYLAPLTRAAPAGEGIPAQVLRGILFEDFLLQRIHGRNANFNPSDHSYIGNYYPESEVRRRWETLDRRSDGLEFIERTDPLFVVKTLETQPLLPTLQEAFEDLVVIHAVRNGNDVIKSSLKRGWYSQEHVRTGIIEWMHGSTPQLPTPWYLRDDMKEQFAQGNPPTRVAAVWTALNRRALEYDREGLSPLETVRYEDLLRSPSSVVDQVSTLLSRSPTKTTRTHLEAIRDFEPTSHPSTVADIAPAVRNGFDEVMSEYGYQS